MKANSVGQEESGLKDNPRKDWFGYLVTGVVGVVVSILATWYQISVSEEQAASIEKERAKSVRQSVIAIVEGQVLNGKKLEVDRVSRLIDQRRREQGVATAISLVDVVQQAEFNILSSSYLDVDRKEEIKVGFNAFYADQTARSFAAFPDTVPDATLLNQLAKQIQDGQSAEALASLRRMQEIHADALEKLSRENRTTVGEAVRAFVSSPLNLTLFSLIYAFAVWVLLRLIRRRRKITGLLRRDWP